MRRVILAIVVSYITLKGRCLMKNLFALLALSFTVLLVGCATNVAMKEEVPSPAVVTSVESSKPISTEFGRSLTGRDWVDEISDSKGN